MAARYLLPYRYALDVEHHQSLARRALARIGNRSSGIATRPAWRRRNKRLHPPTTVFQADTQRLLVKWKRNMSKQSQRMLNAFGGPDASIVRR